MIKNKTTIVALATPPGTAALHIIRISGQDTFEIINKISNSKVVYNTHKQVITLYNHLNRPIDQVVLIKYVSPSSYTGEDMIEINCHGNMLIVQLLLESIIKAGAVLANKGEFTQRAYLNDKINLNQASSILNLIHASSWNEIQCANHNISDKNIQLFKSYLNQIFQWIAYCEIQIDYPDESKNDQDNFYDEIRKKLPPIIESMEAILNATKQKKFSNWTVVLVGRTNAGKSSLINTLLSEERIIVSQEKGTTRDKIEIDYYLPEGLITIVDTAGIFETDNVIDNEAIKQTKSAIKKGDLIVHLIAANDLNNEEDKIIKNVYKNNNSVILYTKSDLNLNMPNNVYKTSSHKKDISDFLKLLSFEFKKSHEHGTNQYGLSNEHKLSALIKIINLLKVIMNSINYNFSIDLLAEDLLMIHHYLFNLLNEKEDAEIINKIFEEFCIGK